MPHPPLPGIPAWLWPRAAAGPGRLLMLDYDGTLAPFQLDRDKAFPHPRSIALVRQIGEGRRTSLAVVSGRPIEALDRLLGPLPAAWLVGEHGWESRSPDGQLVLQPLAEPAGRALREAAARLVERGWGHCLEAKRTALMVHTRALSARKASEVEAECDRIWRARALSPQLRRARVDGGLELRARGHDKGTAVSELVGLSEPGTLAVYLGDDETDEDAFAAVRESGLGIRVGDRPRPSLALGRLESWDEVAEFLERWRDEVERSAAGAGSNS